MKDFSNSNMEAVGDKIKELCNCIDATIECSGVDNSASLGIHVSGDNAQQKQQTNKQTKLFL